MELVLLYAASLIATFIGWYLCVKISRPIPRGVLRATIIAFFCSPGILIGHGIGVAPTLFALFVQPPIYTLVSMLIVWVIALAVIFAVPALRHDRSKWPPTIETVFLNAYLVKFVFFGVVTAALLQATIFADRSYGVWIEVVKFGIFFAAAVINCVLCYWIVRRRQANPFFTPLLFASPSLLVSAPTVALMWYGGGAFGGLIGSGRQRAACWLAFIVFSLLAVNSVNRIFAAANAPAHVTIGGGVAGNAALAAVFAILAIAPWVLYRLRQKRERSIC
jgi:hypothetical protein